MLDYVKENYLFIAFAICTLIHMVLGYITDKEIRKISGGYLFKMYRLFALNGVLPKATSISFFALLISSISLVIWG